MPPPPRLGPRPLPLHLGTALMTWIIADADREGRSVTLHVEPWNPAKRLYERLGFASEGPRGIYEFMRRPATSGLS